MHNLELISLFLAHIAVADEQIHSNEVRAIYEFIDSHGLEQSLKDQIYKIFSDSNDKMSLDEIILRLENADAETQRQALIAGLAVSYSDGYFHASEKKMFQTLVARISFLRAEYFDLKKMAIRFIVEDDMTEQTQPLLKLVAQELETLIQTLNKKHTSEHTPSHPLLAGPEYDDAINVCAQIASEDFNYIEPYYKTNRQSLLQMSETIQEALNRLSHEPSVAEDLKKFQSNVQEFLLDKLEQHHKSLDSKQRALQSYTVSFVGKTKVGKSTLHAVICGEGHEFIGKGMQRTTRYNRVYTWQNIRVIDTPGIGAPGGQTDEQIAESMVDKSDNICFMVDSDSVQETEFQFLEQIRYRNKPVIILLNVKDNIAHPSKLRNYLKDPNEWYTTEGSKSIRGHIERVRRYARTFYKNDRFAIYPVHLLAAKMSSDPQYQEHKEVLYTSSHIQDFLDALRLSIIEEGVLRRSQTILDGTLAVIDETMNRMGTWKVNLIRNRDVLKQKKEELEGNLQKQYERSKIELETIVYSNFNDLLDHTYSFASQYYQKSEKMIQEEWNKHLQTLEFETKLKASIQKTLDEYSQSVKDYTEEIEEDLEILQRIQTEEQKIHKGNTFDYRILVVVFSIAVSLIPDNSHRHVVKMKKLFQQWILRPMIVVIKDSQAERYEKAKNTLYESLNDSINQQSSDVSQKKCSEFDSTHQKVISHIQKVFTLRIEELNKIITDITLLEKQLSTQKREITQVYAWRIVNYAQHQHSYSHIPISINNEAITDTIVYTERNRGGRFIIGSRIAISPQIQEKLTAILQEEIIIRHVVDHSKNSNI